MSAERDLHSQEWGETKGRGKNWGLRRPKTHFQRGGGMDGRPPLPTRPPLDLSSMDHYFAKLCNQAIFGPSYNTWTQILSYI